jgi:hypothetical protein
MNSGNGRLKGLIYVVGAIALIGTLIVFAPVISHG